MKKKKKVGMEDIFKAISRMCLEYNEQHKDDPIVSFSGHIEGAEKSTTIVKRTTQSTDSQTNNRDKSKNK